MVELFTGLTSDEVDALAMEDFEKILKLIKRMSKTELYNKKKDNLVRGCLYKNACQKDPSFCGAEPRGISEGPHHLLTFLSIAQFFQKSSKNKKNKNR